MFYHLALPHVFTPSNILSSRDFQRISKWISPKQTFNYILLYRRTRDSNSSITFHQKCDRIRNTMTIIITEEDWKFGEYIDALWSSKGDIHDWTYKSSELSFIFSLNLKRKYKINKHFSPIFCSGNYEPTFGSHDMKIHNSYFNKTSKCNSPSSYTNL